MFKTLNSDIFKVKIISLICTSVLIFLKNNSFAAETSSPQTPMAKIITSQTNIKLSQQPNDQRKHLEEIAKKVAQLERRADKLKSKDPNEASNLRKQAKELQERIKN